MDHLQTFSGQLAGQPCLLVNARQLHAFLQVGRDFSSWIKQRIEDYGFEAGLDYSPVLANIIGGQEYSPVLGNIQRNRRRGVGKPRQDYHLSLDMAKELAMVERSPRGREARRYFIQMEQTALALQRQQPTLLQALQQALLEARPRWAQLQRYQRLGLGLQHSEMARLCSISPDTVRQQLKHMASLQLVDYRPQPRPLRPHQQELALPLPPADGSQP